MRSAKGRDGGFSQNASADKKRAVNNTGGRR